jgi:predicted DNA-binding protein
VPSSKKQTNVRLSDETKEELEALTVRLADKLGLPKRLSASDVVEMLVRDRALKEGVQVKRRAK